MEAVNYGLIFWSQYPREVSIKEEALSQQQMPFHRLWRSFQVRIDRLLLMAQSNFIWERNGLWCQVALLRADKETDPIRGILFPCDLSPFRQQQNEIKN